MTGAAATAKPASSAPTRSARWGLALLLLVSTVLAYVPAIRGGFVWDDDDYVTENATLHSAGGLNRIWFELGAVPQYYPLVHTTFWLEYHLWGLRPLGFHLTNVLLHALNALLLWAVLRRLRVCGAWVAAAAFALHPMQVESVAWVTERKNVLSGAFYLLAALVYLGGRDLSHASEDDGPDVIRSTLAGLLYVCALLSKSVAATLPAALAVVLWWKLGRVSRRDALHLAAMAPFGIAAGSLTSWMERYSVGATGPEWALSPFKRCLVAGRAFWFYLGKLAWPHPLTFIYPRWDIDHASLAMALFPLTAIALMVALWIARARIGRGPLAAALLYAGTLGPALGFVNVYPMRFSFVADHFAYLAVIAPLVLVAGAAWRLTRSSHRAVRAVVTALGGIALGALFALTWQRGYAYADEETLWRDTLRKNPDSFIANDNLGGILLLRGDLDDASALFEKALRARPRFPEALNDLGLVRQRQGRTDEAIASYRDALRWDPHFVDAHNNLGILLAEEGHLPEAAEHFREVLRIRPSFAKAHLNLGLTLEQLGRTGEAASEYREELRWDPLVPNVARRLAWILATDPDPAVRNGAEAVRWAEAATATTDDKNPQTLDVLAAAYAEAGRFDDAVIAAERAARLAELSARPDVREGAEERLALYRTGRPFHTRRE